MKNQQSKYKRNIYIYINYNVYFIILQSYLFKYYQFYINRKTDSLIFFFLFFVKSIFCFIATLQIFSNVITLRSGLKTCFFLISIFCHCRSQLFRQYILNHFSQCLLCNRKKSSMTNKAFQNAIDSQISQNNIN